VGFTGVFPSAALSYQLYVTNGFKSYDDGPTLRGSDGFRQGRQKGAESFINAPNLAFKVNYFGVAGLQLGFSTHTGHSQTSLFQGVDRSDPLAMATVDSSQVGLTMLGTDARFDREGFQARAQVNVGWVSNTGTYNDFTGSDLGSSLYGWYAEVGFDLLHSFERYESGLIPFVRFEQYNTHASVEGSITSDPALNRTDLTLGIGWRMVKGAMLKVDYQRFGNKASSMPKHQVNAGVAVWF
jgi:hypothetical protein